MRTVTEHLRKHLEQQVFPAPLPTLPQLRASEWSPEFEQLMRNRLVIGAFRYGLFAEEAKWQYRYLDSIRRRLDLFEQDGNLEHLVDCANLCLVEYVGGRKRGLTLRPVDDGEHVEKG